eukprot:1703454-Pyramimonas_sp.AAC.1
MVAHHCPAGCSSWLLTMVAHHCPAGCSSWLVIIVPPVAHHGCSSWLFIMVAHHGCSSWDTAASASGSSVPAEQVAPPATNSQ